VDGSAPAERVKLGDARVKTIDAGEESISELAEGNPALVVFLRHFACPGCSHFLLDLAPRLPELHSLGVRTLLIGSGTVERLRSFAERMLLSNARGCVLATDPSLEAFKAAGLERSKLGTYGPRAFFGSLALYAMGHYARRHDGDGDVEQQGGLFLLDPSGDVVVGHRDRDLMDHGSLDDVIEAALRLSLVSSSASV